MSDNKVKKVKRLYVGMFENGKGEKFWSSKNIGDSGFPDRYSVVLGPFETEIGAIVMASYGGGKTNIRTVQDAERIAKLAKELWDDLSKQSPRKKQS